MDAIFGLIGVLIGTGLTVTVNLLISRLQYINSRNLDASRWEEERNRTQIQDIKDTLWHYIDRMEVFVSDRRALMIALNNPLLQPQTVMNNLFKDTWKTGGQADEAAVIARNFGNVELARDIVEFERLFSQIWKVKIGRGEGQELQDLENEANIRYTRIVSRIQELRVRIPQINLSSTHRFRIQELPRLMSDTEHLQR